MLARRRGVIEEERFAEHALDQALRVPVTALLADGEELLEKRASSRRVAEPHIALAETCAEHGMRVAKLGSLEPLDRLLHFGQAPRDVADHDPSAPAHRPGHERVEGRR